MRLQNLRVSDLYESMDNRSYRKREDNDLATSGTRRLGDALMMGAERPSGMSHGLFHPYVNYAMKDTPPTQSSPLSKRRFPRPPIRRIFRHMLSSLRGPIRSVIRRKCRKPHPIFSVNDVVSMIFSFADLATLASCARVNKEWNQEASKFLYKNPSQNGVRPLLNFMDTFYYTVDVEPVYQKRWCRLSKAPSPASWTRFEAIAGIHIRSFTLDLKSLVASQEFLEILLASFPKKLALPQLRNLHIMINEDEIELALAAKFMRRTVTNFAADIWAPVPDSDRELHTMLREAYGNFPMQFPHETPLHPSLLPDFFKKVISSMPDITRIDLNVHDVKKMSDAWSQFLDMSLSLPELHTIRLPPHALPPGVSAALAGHPTLRSILMNDIDGALPDLFYDAGKKAVIDDVALAGCATLPKQLTQVALTSMPAALASFSDIYKSRNITHLHLCLPTCLPADTDLNALFSLFASSLPSLEGLKLFPLAYAEGVPLRLDYSILHPLARCTRLVSLDIRATHTSHITNDEFTCLVSQWPYLQLLTLDGPGVVCVDPEEEATLSFRHVMSSLRECCPDLRELSLYVHMDLPPLDLTTKDDAHPSSLENLKRLNLCIGFPTPFQAEVLAGYLDYSLPKACQLNFQTGSRTSATVWQNRHDTLSAYARRVTSKLTHLR